jgi:hypothetical protein
MLTLWQIRIPDVTHTSHPGVMLFADNNNVADCPCGTTAFRCFPGKMTVDLAADANLPVTLVAYSLI